MSLKQLLDLTGKTALITGGSRGLGLQIAAGYGEMGARIVISARKADELEAACTQLKRAGVDASWIAADAASAAEVARLSREAIARLGHVDILVNNAGATWGAPAEDHPLEAWDKVMNLNIRGVFLLTQAVGRAQHDSAAPWPHHQRRFDRRPVRQSAGTDEHDRLQHQQGRAGELHARAGDRVGSAQHHGQRARARLLPVEDDQGCHRAARRRARWRASRRCKRIGDDEDLKGAALLFASDAGKHITGQILAVDGGASAY